MHERDESHQGNLWRVRPRLTSLAMRGGLAVAAGLAGALVLSFAVPSRAQDGANVEQFEPRPLGFVGLGRSDTLTWGEWAVGGYVHYSHNQLVLFADRLQVGEIVSHRLSLDLLGTMGLLRWLEAQVALPVTLYQSGDDDLPTGELTTAGLRDLRLSVKASILSVARRQPFGLGLRLDLSLPTGDPDAFLGDGSVTFAPTLVIDRTFAWLWGVSFLGSIAPRIRSDAQVGSVELASELDYRLGAAMGLPPIGPFAWRGFFELQGRTKIDEPFQDVAQSPLNLRVGLQAEWGKSASSRWHTAAGTSFGATQGYGAPDVHVFAGAVYAHLLTDRDGDGILDRDDACPDEPEDFDGYQDADGCPEVDADRDGIPDETDACPLEPEDADAFEDDDGCPDPDNDRDGIPDTLDACPLEPEDLDGFDDEDGCREEDTDRDGIPDHLDACPDEREVINGFEDDDGCPDEGEIQVEVTSEKVKIDSKIAFGFDTAEIAPSSYSLLDQIALTIKANPQLARIRVEGHTDERGPADYNQRLSQARAEAVLAYLVRKGVSARRLVAVGYGEELPLVMGQDEEAFSKNRRVEFTILGSDESPGR